MLTGLLTRHLRPYAPQVALVIVLLVAQSDANLYLPNLNADIINNGVVKGDTAYIWRTGGLYHRLYRSQFIEAFAEV